MKKVFYTILATLPFTNIFAQKTEYQVGLNSGLFSFSGNSSSRVSFINYSSAPEFAYTTNPYGSKNGLCYGISGSVKSISKRKIVFGLEIAYECLRSQISINEISMHNGTSISQFPANGETILNFGFINFEPFAGYRLVLKRWDLDFTAGVDLAHCLHGNEKGRATITTNQTTIKTSVDRKTKSLDLRPRLQMSAGHKKFGVYLGYSFGQVNYLSTLIGGNREAYARLLRFGINYQIGSNN